MCYLLIMFCFSCLCLSYILTISPQGYLRLWVMRSLIIVEWFVAINYCCKEAFMGCWSQNIYSYSKAVKTQQVWSCQQIYRVCEAKLADCILLHATDSTFIYRVIYSRVWTHSEGIEIQAWMHFIWHKSMYRSFTLLRLTKIITNIP